MNTTQKGEIAYLKVALRAAEKGLVVSKPTTDARYDLVVDDGGKLLRVQIKYTDSPSSRSAHAVAVGLRRTTNKLGATPRVYSAEEVDLLLVYVPQLDVVVQVQTPDFCGKTGLILRLQPSRNGQKKGVLLVSEHLW